MVDATDHSGKLHQEVWYGTPAGIRRALDREKILCFAVSEPQTGAHPKYLKTTAKLLGDQYILNGQKTYLTNGPIADMFIVVAITGEVDSRKSFSAFLVPKDTTGLTITSMELPFLKPAPHGTLMLENSPVPAKNVLGKEGRAFQDMVEPFPGS